MDSADLAAFAVADLQRRATISDASNKRYLESIATCPTDTTLIEIVGEVCQRTRHHGRSVRAINPSSAADSELLRFLAQGQ